MKQLLKICCFVALSLCLVGCGKDGADENPAEQQQPKTIVKKNADGTEETVTSLPEEK